MALRDYSNGSNPGLANMINNINDQEQQRQNEHREHLEMAGKIGLAYVIGSLLQSFFARRR